MWSPGKKRTKIIATLGPACDQEDTLRAMIAAGMNVVRINFSHAQHDALRKTLLRVRRAATASGTPVAIMGDLRGPRIRVGEMAGGAITLEAGKDIVLTPEACMGVPGRVQTTFPGLAGDVSVDTPLLLDDGNLLLRVREVRGPDVQAHIERGGLLSSNRGINLPGRRVSLPSITDKDEADIDFAVAEGFDFLAMSFVQSAADVRGLQEKIAARGADIPVIAKIEKKSALDDIEAIARTAYGVMVARGDLALEMSLPEVPIAQKRIIAACRQAASPVITATQMLETMTHAPKPTRAEATDVANAIFDGTDAVMLSGESAVGEYPVETVAMMSAIALRAEAAWLGGELPGPPPLVESSEPGTVVAHAAEALAMNLGARAIITHTTGGTTTRRVSCHRPRMPILALSPDDRVRRRLALVWGVESERSEKIRGTAHMVELALKAAAARCGAQPGDIVVIVAGTPYRVSGRTNLIKVETVPLEGQGVGGGV